MNAAKKKAEGIKIIRRAIMDLNVPMRKQMLVVLGRSSPSARAQSIMDRYGLSKEDVIAQLKDILKITD